MNKIIKLILATAAFVSSTTFGQMITDPISVAATLTESDTSITVSSTAVDFGELSIPDSGDAFYGTFGFNVAWKAPNGSNFSIVVYSDNAGDIPGLSDGTNSVELKFNNENLGNPADVNNPTSSEFAGASAMYLFVLDDGTTPFEFINQEDGGYFKAIEDQFACNFALRATDTTVAGVYNATIYLDLIVEN